MKKIACFAILSAASLALAGCGSSGDASEDAKADNVEMPADKAMAGATEAPAADADANAADEADANAGDEAVDPAEAAGEAAADAAADVAAAAGNDEPSDDTQNSQ